LRAVTVLTRRIEVGALLPNEGSPAGFLVNPGRIIEDG